jgi:predicted kinase
MPKLIMLVGPPGSGKSTFAKNIINNILGPDAYTYVNQDSQGKLEHMNIFRDAMDSGFNIIIDRMNFNRVQRLGYIEQARKVGYEIFIHVFHQPYAVCLERASKRKDHETIKDEETAKKAIGFFFKSYERVEDWEANKVVRHYPEGDKPKAIICDLDGTLFNINHRLHHVRTEGRKKNWPDFMDGIKDDKLNQWCADILKNLMGDKFVVLCSGRSENERSATLDCLHKYNIMYNDLFMRQAGDSRQDAIVKEILLDFEILTRYEPYFFIDDRKQVYEMWRKRGFVCLACADGDF